MNTMHELDKYQQAIIKMLMSEVPTRGDLNIEAFFFRIAQDERRPEYLRKVAALHAENITQARETRERRRREKDERVARSRRKVEDGCDSRLSQDALDAIWGFAWENGHDSGMTAVEVIWDEIHDVVVVALDTLEQ